MEIVITSNSINIESPVIVDAVPKKAEVSASILN